MKRRRQFAIVNAVVVIAISLVVLVIAKNYVTFHHQLRVTHAIYGYQMDCIKSHRDCFVKQKDKESYTETFLRLWDWGDRNILDYEDYVLVRRYIGWRPSESRIVRER